MTLDKDEIIPLTLYMASFTVGKDDTFHVIVFYARGDEDARHMFQSVWGRTRGAKIAKVKEPWRFNDIEFGHHYDLV